MDLARPARCGRASHPPLDWHAVVTSIDPFGFLRILDNDFEHPVFTLAWATSEAERAVVIQ
jgi:hypothetical protein